MKVLQTSHERGHHIVERIMEASTEIIEVVRSNAQDVPVQERLFERMVEQSVENNIHRSMEEIVPELFSEYVVISSPDRIPLRTVEQIEAPVAK